jgi:hypothetical protein
MPRKRHTSEQIIRKLRQAEADLAAGLTIGQVCQKLEIAEQTFHRWRNRIPGTQYRIPEFRPEFRGHNTNYRRIYRVEYCVPGIGVPGIGVPGIGLPRNRIVSPESAPRSTWPAAWKRGHH